MKTWSFTTFVLVCTGILLKAQTNQGTWILGTTINPVSIVDPAFLELPSNGMNIGFATVKNKFDNGNFSSESKASNFNLSLAPQVGYFLANNLMVGLNLNVGIVGFKEENSDESDNTTYWMFGPHLRYYFGAGSVRPYLNSYFLIGSFNSTDSENSTGITNAGGGIGLAYFPNPGFSLDAQLGYHFNRLSSEFDGFPGLVKETVTSSRVALQIGFTFFIQPSPRD